MMLKAQQLNQLKNGEEKGNITGQVRNEKDV